MGAMHLHRSRRDHLEQSPHPNPSLKGRGLKELSNLHHPVASRSISSRSCETYKIGSFISSRMRSMTVMISSRRAAVKRRQRLVHQQHARPAEQGAADGDALRLAAGERAQASGRADAPIPKNATASSRLIQRSASCASAWP